MKIHELNKHWRVIRSEFETLPKYTHSTWVDDDVASGFYKWLLLRDDKYAPGAKWCPQTVSLLESLDETIQYAGFSVFTGGSGLSVHVDTEDDDDTYKCTYHLGIKCPKNCYLWHAKNGICYEMNGKGFTMDNRYPHSATNGSKQDRVILYITINHNRPNLFTRVKRLLT